MSVMVRSEILVMILLVLSMNVSASYHLESSSIEVIPDTSIMAKREYYYLQTKGDSLFIKGIYVKAYKKYLAMMAIPGFENDSNAIRKEEIAHSCYDYASEISVLLSKNKVSDAMSIFQTLLQINPEDIETRRKFGEHWFEKGMEQYRNSKYNIAKEYFTKSLEYSPKSQTSFINQYITYCESPSERLKSKRTPIYNGKPQESLYSGNEPNNVLEPIRQQYKPMNNKVNASLIIPKIGVGVAAVGSGYYVYNFWTEYNNRVITANELADAIPSSPMDKAYESAFRAYEKAFQEASDFKSNNESMAMSMLGVSIAAIVVESTIFLISKKSRRIVSFSPGLSPTMKLSFVLK